MWKAAVIGLGKIGLMYDFEIGRELPSSHVSAYHLHKNFELVMASDPCEERKEYLNKIAPEACYFNDNEKGLQYAQADIVSICTPPNFHLSTIRKVYSLKKIPAVIFCEKPLANSLKDADDILHLCEKYPQVTLVPNISRRWSNGLNRVTNVLKSGKYGRLKSIHIRYTRGIYNTGAHMFDLLNMWTNSKISEVHVLKKVHTTSENEGESSYSFFFEQNDGVWGYAEAMDDEHYYMFEIDMYLTGGKIEMRFSGDEILYYATDAHHLFTGYQELHLTKKDEHILSEPLLMNAIDNLAGVLLGTSEPACRLEDAIYPIKVAVALEKSFANGTKEHV